MAYEQLKDSALPRSLSAVFADLADLIQKEVRLARVELSSKISKKLQMGLWMGVAGLLGLLAGFLVIQALVFWIASLGLAMHWSCLIVAVLLAIAGGLAYRKAQADAQAGLSPTRTIHQVKQDIGTIKEQLT